MTVVGVGAWCELDLSPLVPAEQLERSRSFHVHEFVDLANGTRVTLHTERGLTIASHPAGDPMDTMTMDSLTSSVLMVVLPDDENDTEAHPWAWLASLAGSMGVVTTPEHLKHLSYAVEFGPELLAAFRQRGAMPSNGEASNSHLGQPADPEADWQA